MNEEIFVFDSNGGCAICDSMDGEYDAPVERPHEHCNCEIYAKPVAGDDDDDRCFEISLEDYESSVDEWDSSGNIVAVLYKVSYIIRCIKSDYEVHGEYEEVDYDFDKYNSEANDEDIDSDILAQESALLQVFENATEEAESEAESECECGEEEWRCC